MEFIGAGEIIKRSWSLYWSNWTKLVAIAAWSIIPVVASLLIAYIPQQLWPAALFLSIAVGIGAVIIGLWVYATLTMIIARMYYNEKFDEKEIYQRAWEKIIPLLWVSILSGLVIFAGTLLFVIPGILFAVWFAFASVVNILEGTKGREALSESKKLVEGKWWSVFWRFIATYFVFGVLFYLAVIVIMVLIGLLMGGFEAFADPSDTLIWLENIAQGVINVIAMPLFSAVTIIIYLELKKFKNIKKAS